MAQRAFSTMGDVRLVPGRQIDRTTVEDAEMLLVRSVTPVSAELLDGSEVRFVASATIGVDHIDTPYLAARGITFAHAPGSNANSVAEYVVAALIFSAARQGVPLAGRTLGIVGVGNVGSRVARLAAALGVRCLLNDPPLRRRTGDERLLPLEEVLAESDIVTMHVPLTFSGDDPTFHLAGESFFAAMRAGATFINTSRGAVVDEAALRVHRAELADVILDVWEDEPAPSPATIEIASLATPHIAGYSYDGKVNGTQMIYDSAREYVGGAPALHLRAEMGVEPAPLDLRGSPDPIRDAVNAAYPIVEDDSRFRSLRDMPTPRRAEFFDQLRKDYPRRLEFCHFRVSADAAYRERLGRLGFCMP